MADATIALETLPYPKGVDNTQRRQIVYGTATITANAGTAPATGLPLDWTKITDGNGGSGTFIPQASGNPQDVFFYTSTDAATAAQLYTYDPTNNSLIVWRSGAPATTLIAADTVRFKAEFIRGV